MQHMSLDRLHQLFEQASAIGGDERAAFLAANCETSDERRELETLLAAAADADRQHAETLWSDHFSSLRAAAMDAAGHTLRSGMQMGDFTLVRRLGTGGMGEVWEATQDRPRRSVAVKVLRPGMQTVRILRRFELEAESLARLANPGIASIYGAGVSDVGYGAMPWFAMELVREAQTITRWIAETRPPLATILRLLAEVCDAVHHGHLKGVVHRDLKPSNILVDAAGRAKVIDFGVARCRGSDIAVTTLHTQVGEVIGTLQYMSPEQVGSSDVDARSDVYALGVVAFECLSCDVPYDVGSAHLTEAARIVTECEPPKLPRTLRRSRSLDAIVRVAMAKDPARRYQSAAAMAEDLRRAAAARPIQARPPHWIELLALAAARRPLASALIAVLLFTLVTASVIVWWQADRTLAAASRRSLLAASMAIAGHDLATAESALAEVPEASRNWPWRLLAGQASQWRSAVHQSEARGNAYALAAPAHGQPGLVCSDNKSCRSMTDLSQRSLEVDHTPWRAAWLPDGGLVVLQLPGELVRVDPNDRVEPIADQIAAIAATDSGVAVAHRDGRVDLLGHAGTMTPRCHTNRTDTRCVAAEGGLTLLGMLDGDVLLSRGEDVTTLPCVHERRVEDVAISDDGTWGVSVSTDGRLVRWDLVTGGAASVTRPHDGAIHGVAISEDGVWVATGGNDRTIRVFDAGTMEQVDVFPGHSGIVWDVAFDPRGFIVSAGEDSDAAEIPWPRQAELPPAIATLPAIPASLDWAAVAAMATSPDGRWIAVSEGGDGDGKDLVPNARLAILDAASGGILRTTATNLTRANALSWHPSSDWLAIGGREGRVHACWPGQDRVEPLLDRIGWTDALAFDPAGDRLAIAVQSKEALIYDVARREVTATLTGNLATIPNLLWTEDGQWLVTGASDGRVQVWDPRNAALLVSLRPFRGQVTSLEIEPASGDLLVGDERRRVHRLPVAGLP